MGSFSLFSLPTPDHRIGTSPSKSGTAPQFYKVANFNVCSGECDLAGIIKLTEGVTWSPQLSDKSTEEWQMLAKEIRTQVLSSMFHISLRSLRKLHLLVYLYTNP